jgi:murein DD-endopeptidase MepM/ murein hydrolase activator NlpD
MRRARGLPLLACALAALAAPPVRSETVSKSVGLARFSADLTQAFPGGLIVAHVASRGRLGTVYAILDGRRALVYGARALVPIPAESEPGADVLGFELLARGGRQRIPLDVQIMPRGYAPRSVVIPEARRALLAQPHIQVEARQLMVLLRTESPVALWQGAFKAPVAAASVASFGAPQAWGVGTAVEQLLDGSFGERHRGLDYETGAGIVVQAPAAGVVLFAGSRVLTGGTVVLDHGQGVVSLLAHLSRVEVREGEQIEGRTPIGLVGESGLAYAPHLHWGVYVHGVAVDPRVLEALGD